MLRGKVLHVARDAENGVTSFTTQGAALRSFASGVTDLPTLKVDRKVAKRENSAKHVSTERQILAGRARWSGPESDGIPECLEIP